MHLVAQSHFQLDIFDRPDLDALELYRRSDVQAVDRTVEVEDEFLRFAK